MPNPNSPAGDTDNLSNVANTDGQQGVDAGTNQDAKDDTAGTSDAESRGAKEPELDLEAVIRKAVSKEGDGAEDTPANGKDGEGNAPGDQGADADGGEDGKSVAKTAEEQAAEDAKLPFHKHPRWKEVLRERDTIRGERDALTAKVGEIQPKAEQFDRIGAFMRDNELSAEEVQRGFEIMATMKHDPAKALELLAPHLEGLQLVTGQRLPKDLQERVDAGSLELEDAQREARTRIEAVMAQDKARRAEQTVTTERERADAEIGQKLAAAMREGVEKWEQDVKGRDPDYPKLQSFVTDRARVLLQTSKPKTVEEAVALTNKAYELVKAEFRKVLPRGAVRTVKSDTSSTRAEPQPTSMLDVVKQALRQ